MHLKFADMSLFQLAERGSKCNKVFAYIIYRVYQRHRKILGPGHKSAEGSSYLVGSRGILNQLGFEY